MSANIINAAIDPQYILVNKQMPGGNWNQNVPASIQKSDFEEINKALPNIDGAKIKIAVPRIK